MGITDPWEAWAVNRAALWAGMHEPPKPKALDFRKTIETTEGGRRKPPPRR